MRWDYAERRRRERNYRVMFKSALAFVALGVILTLIGMIAAAQNADVKWLCFGLFVFSIAGISAWLSVNSTVKIIEMDMKERRAL